MLQTLGLTKDYKTSRAVDNLDLEVRPGEIVCLLGPNGAGKTTALRCMCGILRPNGGQVILNGVDIVADPVRAKSRLSFVPEVPALYELLTVEEHLRFIAMCFNRIDLFEALKEGLLEKYDLREKRNELVATLSKGMRQKLSVACALIHDANILLFDEPLIGIDPAGAHEFKEDLRGMRNQGAALLVSTHLLDTAERLADRVVILKKGRKIADGTFEGIKAALGMEGQTLEEVFLKLTEDGPSAP